MTLLLRNIHTLVLMDPANRVLRDAYVYAEEGEVARIGTGSARRMQWPFRDWSTRTITFTRR